MTTRKDYKLLQQRMAIERTVLANERTLLSYIRTGFALLIAGLSFMYFTEDAALITIGLLFIPLSAIAIIFGIIRFKKVQKTIRDEMQALPDTL